MHEAIRVEDLAKTYPSGVEALSGVTFSVEGGEIFAYLGRNGAGKTTTLRILATLMRPSRGTVHIEGLDVEASPDDVRRHIGVAQQVFGLDERMTGREHLVLFSRLSNEPDTSSELLERFDLSDAADRRVGAYSWGMRRRLDIALALVRRPRVLFLDEPTTGLDPQGRRTIWSMLKTLRDEGVAIFLTTQNIDEADHMASRIAILDGGRIVAEGTPEALKTTYAPVALPEPSLEDIFIELTGDG